MSIPRTHVIDIYDPPGDSGDPYGEPGRYTLVGKDVPANLQPLTGKVEQTAAGRAIEAEWKGFVPPKYGEYIEADRVVVVTEGVGPSTYRIRQAGPQGGPWDAEFLLGVTAEDVPGPVGNSD